MNPTTTVLIVEDHEVFRDGLRTLLDSLDQVEVVGEAATGGEAIELAAEMVPSVVLMDLHLPDMSGVDATRTIRERVPASSVLVLTMVEDDDTVRAALEAGALGYLVKGSSRDEIAHAVELVAAGGAVLGGTVAASVLRRAARPPADPLAEKFPMLTPREREVLALLAGGRSTAEIAQATVLSVKTIRNLVSSMLTKLNLSDRRQAIDLAMTVLPAPTQEAQRRRNVNS